jgi:hypothetical protein
MVVHIIVFCPSVWQLTQEDGKEEVKTIFNMCIQKASFRLTHKASVLLYTE